MRRKNGQYCYNCHSINKRIAINWWYLLSLWYTGQEVVSYESPRPMMGIHRIIFILFRQSGRQTIYAPGWRQNFNTRDFSEVYNLGLPVAATYFNCKRQNNSARDGRRTWLIINSNNNQPLILIIIHYCRYVLIYTLLGS